MPTMLNFQKEDFVLLKFQFKVEFADWTAPDDIKKTFNSTDNILIKPDKTSVPGDLKEKLFDLVEKIKNVLKRYS